MNEPPFWAAAQGDLVVRSGPKTDFWLATYYGFKHDNGHFLHRPWIGDLTAEASFTGRYEALCDQAGLMLRADAEHWIKCGIELSDGALQLSVVVTNGRCDWSVQQLAGTVGPVSVRLSRIGDAGFVQFRVGDAQWAMARLAAFPPEPAAVEIGLAFCSPQRSGFDASFHDFRVDPPISREIHG